MTLPIGIHDCIAAEIYHRDEVTPEPALSRSGIVTLLDETPAAFAAQNPRLTQWPERLDRKGTDATDLGEVIHRMVLGDGCTIVVGSPSDHTSKKGEPYSTWTGAAKEWRDEQRALGNIVIDPETNAKALTVADRLTAALIERFGAAAWGARKVEQTLIWKRRLNDGTEIWCRARPDAILPDGTIVDPKTTALSLADFELGKRIAVDGLDVQHAWYQDGAYMLDELGVYLPGKFFDAEKPPFIFAFASTVPPYTVRFVDLDKRQSDGTRWPLNLTRMRIDRACHLFGDALKTKTFADHPIDANVQPPTWWVSKIEAELGLEIEA